MTNQRVLILSPHTDDAELGCGGTIIRLLEEGNTVHWIVFSTAEDSLPKGMPKDTLKREFLNVADSLKIPRKQIKIFRYKVRYLFEKRQQILEKLVEARRIYNPTLVIGPSLHDLHQDHIIVANEMVRAFKSSASIISYELPWNHVTFNTQMLVKLETRQIEAKINLLRHYKSQFAKNRQYFSDAFINGLAAARGVQAGCQCAEAFEIIRWIQ
jgi:N-acetylglucosamine malate deacetylase 1